MQIGQQKQELRELLRSRRKEQVDRHAKSAIICDQLLATEDYHKAETVLLYLSYGSEVETKLLFEQTIAQSKIAIVPYCDGKLLKLCICRSASELAVGTHNIPEPKSDIRCQKDRQIEPSAIDLAIIPGLGFCPDGTRLGQGKGYYDRLLAKLSPSCFLVGLCFECQLLPTLPRENWDQPVNCIITEKCIYQL